MPTHGGTTIRFMRPRALQPPTIQLGNSGIDPPAQVPQRDIIDAQMAFFGTGCIINEQVILQDQEGVLAWVSERLAVAMRQATGRVWRESSKTKSIQKILFVSGTIEEKVCENVRKKLDNLDLLNDGDLIGKVGDF